MRVFFIITLLIAFNGLLNAQADSSQLKKAEPLTYCEQMPEYPGGTGEMMKFLIKHVQLYTVQGDSGIRTAIHIKFVVDETGKTRDVQFPKFNQVENDKNIEQQLKKAVLSMPLFTPGKQAGKNVAVWMQLPIRLCPVK